MRTELYYYISCRLYLLLLLCIYDLLLPSTQMDNINNIYIYPFVGIFFYI